MLFLLCYLTTFSPLVPVGAVELKEYLFLLRKTQLERIWNDITL